MDFMLTDTERQLATERQLKYQGTAKINLTEISLHPSVDRTIDQKNVQRLCHIFLKDGCQRLDIRNHVTAIVSRRHLTRACHDAGLTPEELKSHQRQYPHLRFSGHPVQCLHGQHRLKAGEETLAPSDQWWIVDLYLDDISQDLQHALVDEYANERHPTDGEVYRKIRQYQHESNALFQNRWWSRLSPNKAKRLRQLFSQENTFICAGFDALLPIPGLWKGMSLGSLNSVFALKCDEEIVHYLRVIWTFWAALANQDRTWMARIDTHTVDELQLYAPRASKVDWTTVKGKILSGEVFSNFSRSERASIWENLRSKEACDGIIPSLHTFFRDISYLELCANAVKRLVVLNKQRPTVRSALVHSFRPRHGDGDYLVQTSETTFRRQRGSTTECITSGYRQIWMYAMRHYPDMAKDVQCGHLKANPARAKARAKADESVIHDMAALAQKLGFRTPQIKEILKQSPDRQIARATLLKARKPDRYHYDSETFESLVDRIVGCFVLAIPNESQPTMALVTGQAPKLHDRCGTPQEQAQKLDRPHLFMDRLHAETVRQKNLSSLEVRRCVYYAFFGKPASATSTQSTMLGHSPGSEPLSPLFLPNDDSAIESESGEEITSRRSLDRGSVYGRRDRPERHRERLRNREERRHRQHGCEQRSQQSAVHTSSPPGKPLPRTSTDEGSDVSEPIRMDIFESSDLEDLEPQPGIHTSSPPGDPLPRNSTGEGSDVSEPICMDISESSDSGDPEPQPGVHTSSAPREPSPRTSIGEGCDVSERATIDISESSDSGDPEPQPGAHTSSPPREPSYPTSTGERSDVNEPIRMDIFESSDSEDLGPQPGVQSDVGIKERERTESDEDELGREEQKRREREPLLRGAEEQVENERFECKVVETEQGLLVREELSDGERQRDDAKDDAHVTQQEGNERATVAKALLADHQGLRTEEDLMVPAATAKEVEELLNEMLQGKSGLRAANEDASVPEEQVSLERADALARLESKAEALTVELEDMVEGSNEIVSSVGGRLSPVHSEGTTETAGAAELGPSRQVQERHVASLPGPEQAHKEAVERRAAEESLFDGPLTEDQTIEEAQENEPIGTAAVPSKRKRSSSLRHEQDAQIRVREIKAVRESKRVKQSQVGESGTPGASQVELAFPLRAVNLEERVSEGLESTASGPGSHEQPDNRPEVPAPLAPESRDGELPHDVPPGQRVTLTFHAYDSGRWTRTDTVSVSLDNPTEAQIIADRYARDRSKNARFYDEGLRKVAADECVRAAIVDGSFKILMSFGKDLVVTRFLVASVKQLLQK
ncbi:hypothetical protein KXV74_008673 [Aspergillus fumigatus]|nr:hypothetical protein KXX38_001700 [Aspergillus fumigatus]KAH1357328.1 hypothetical protein KXX14_009428 [Aspergillus fumigatus]KAH1490799.1 hypothetical protein KXX42_009405 [Aspergillus fumigatus]KAH1607963.1 hypothetical protein KXX44_008396 [Aspergillus fumigatus]KAH1664016.1 hypothetical protein KXX65_001733 [Aspergillus fumigatus]